MPHTNTRPSGRKPTVSGLFKVKIIVLAAVCIVAVTAGASYAILTSINQDLPQITSLKNYKPPVGTQIFSEDDHLIGRLKVDKGIFVPLSQMPESLRKAVVAIEDARFYEHSGLDFQGILRAVLKDAISISFKEGGSTITQQLAKVLFLTPEKSFTRKIKEALLARKIEKSLSKDEILELYLNKIYLGHGAYGMEMAARTYFGKRVGDLSLAESAMLAGLIRSPMGYSPYNNMELAKKRQETVLRRMAEEKLISRGQESKAAAQAIILKNLREGEEVAPYLVEQIRLYLESKYGVQKVYMEGLNVKTTINYGMQKAAAAAVESGVRDLDKRQGWRGPLAKRDPKEIDRLEDDTGVKQSAFHPGEIVTATVLKVDDNGAAISARGCKGYISSADMRWASGRDGKKKPPQILMPGYVIEARVKGSGKKGMTFSLEQEPISQGALVALDPWEGKVKAMVGGVDFQKSEFNHAVYAHRQPGSAFKPFVYAAAMESGFTPASIINDEPRSYDDDKWKPANYDREYYGPTRLREALVHSRNVVTIELLHEVGVNKVISLAKSLGMDGPFAGNLTLALGSGSVTPLELTAAYAVFANGGYKVTPITITEVTDRRGKVIESNGTSVEQALSFSTTYQVTSMLEDAVKRGTGQLATILGRPVAGKTGTTNDYKDAWFVGYTPYLVAGVWVGNDDQKPLGHGESGSRAALPIWVRFMSNAQTAYPPDGFTIPDEIEFVDVDSETGLLPTAACKEVVLECFKKGTAPHEYAQSIPEVRKETVPAAATESAPVTEDKKKRLLQDVD